MKMITKGYHAQLCARYYTQANSTYGVHESLYSWISCELGTSTWGVI